LISPANNLPEASINQTFKWAAIPGANFELQLADNASFFSPKQVLTPSTAGTINNLKGRTTYYWRVRAKNAFTVGNWSDVWNITTGRDLGINPTLADDIHVYPNPAGDHLFIQTSGNLLFTSFSITDMKSSTVLEGVLIGPITPVNINHLKNGIYTLTLRSQNGLVQQKIVVGR